MKQVYISYQDSGRWVPLCTVVWNGKRLMDAEDIAKPIAEWVARGCSIRSNWGQYSLNGIRYEYEYGDGAISRMRGILGLPTKGKLSDGQIRRAYNQSMLRLDLKLAERLGAEFVELCENLRSDVQEAADDLALRQGFDLVEVKRVEEARENADLDAIFSM